ncbi:unnamed protein product [Protopolystoma xenopodis]|uniref:Uncharacterized protein n=1 Tax=Protopolystoma xenopodis TaxID=117903 RepID=A0A3S5CEH3_9PLAT|nr:unnamed protein product [Protopolystoma xenopodis]
MLPLKSNRSTYNMVCKLREWDKATKEKRKIMLQDFIDQNKHRSGPELEIELAQMASLLLARICVWIKLTYMTGTCLTEQLQVKQNFALNLRYFSLRFLRRLLIAEAHAGWS